MRPEQNSAAYLLGLHGDPWAIHPERMKAYLNTLIVSDMSAEDIEARTGPTEVELVGESDAIAVALWKKSCKSVPPENSDVFCAAVALGAGIADATKLLAGGFARPSQRNSEAGKVIGVLRMTGPITQRAGLFTAFFGGTSTEKFQESFDALMANDAIGGIVVDIDSPGGTVDGVPELAEHIFQSRGKKPLVGVANTWAASAAYWLGTAFDELVVTPSGEVGSIGVWAMHTDFSGMEEQAGIKTTLISAGEFKTEGNPYEPLGDEAREEIQRGVDHYHGMFERAVAKQRGIPVETVRKDFGKGRMLRPKDAVAAGMADRVATLDQTIRRMQSQRASRATARAQAAAREAELRGLELA